MPDSMIEVIAERKRDIFLWAHSQFLDPRWPLFQEEDGTVSRVLLSWVLAPVRLAMRGNGSPLLVETKWAAIQKNMKVDFGMLYDRMRTLGWASHIRRMGMLLYDVQDSTGAHPDGGFYWNPKPTEIVVTTSGQTPVSVRSCYRELGYAGGTHPDTSHPPATPPPATPPAETPPAETPPAEGGDGA